MRVALACALFISPDLLLLDEPTNHLDLETILWLQDYLASYDGTVVVVSHDKAFLNEVATDIIHFHKRNLQYYPNCNFDSFEKVRNDKLLRKVHAQEQLDLKREHMLKSIQKMEKAASHNKMDQKRMQQVSAKKKKYNKVGYEQTEDGKRWTNQDVGVGYRPGSINENGGGWKGGKMTARTLVEAPDPTLKFNFPAAESLGVLGAVIQLRDISFQYQKDTPYIVNGVSLTVTMESKIAIVGHNGAGKSTLLNLIKGDLQPTKGEIYRHQNLSIAFYSQHHVDQLNLSSTPLQHMSQHFPLAKEQELRSHLGSFGISGKLALRKIGTLSGGQKSRVVFASITYKVPHMLILDEPTNHLDFETIKALTDALKAFEGAVILVSHNQSLIAELANEIWVVGKGTAKKINGDFEDYKQRVVNGEI